MTRAPSPHSATPNSAAPDPVTAPVQRAYDRYGQQAEKWQAGYRARGGKIFCGAGCFQCCNMPIRVSLAEALITARALDPAQAQAVEAHARAAIQNARTARDDAQYVQRHRQEVGFCPLLDRETGACTQYAARPTRCRDTFSAFPAHYCAEGTWEAMSAREKREYHKQVARTPGTDGEWHFIAPLEHLSEPVWMAAAKSMRAQWNLEAWGDFWLLTTLAASAGFMARIERGDARGAWQVASGQGLAHRELLEIG